MAKPFSLEEVVARLRGLMRRTVATTTREDALLVVGDLTLDEDSHEVRRSDDQVDLTAAEFELLRYLMRNPRVLSKAQILDRVWSYDFGGGSCCCAAGCCGPRDHEGQRCEGRTRRPGQAGSDERRWSP